LGVDAKLISKNSYCYYDREYQIYSSNYLINPFKEIINNFSSKLKSVGLKKKDCLMLFRLLVVLSIENNLNIYHLKNCIKYIRKLSNDEIIQSICDSEGEYYLS
jgi:hypothetical protein